MLLLLLVLIQQRYRYTLQKAITNHLSVTKIFSTQKLLYDEKRWNPHNFYIKMAKIAQVKKERLSLKNIQNEILKIGVKSYLPILLLLLTSSYGMVRGWPNRKPWILMQALPLTKGYLASRLTLISLFSHL